MLCFLFCCRDTQVHLDLTYLLKSYRPDLLDTYLMSSALKPPSGHPCNIIQPTRDMAVGSENSSLPKEDQAVQRKKEVVKATKVRQTLYCPSCDQSFVDNRLGRLIKHVKQKHVEEADKLLSIISEKYPPKRPKTVLKFMCQVCQKCLVGSSTHVRAHHAKHHPGIRFKDPLKVQDND